ncbi:NAD(P)-binding protein [Pholiota conissans]|uniref:NAD(P)-binding protein n=1 Tax=Pholiota conissans TaxID=109636 RepID=A0A9P5YRP4_9AGAR|nr:NAD(P)-binding protein [Pholiota conissans]
MSPKLPATTRALVLQESKEQRKPLYHDAALVELPLAQPKPGEVVVKIVAVGFNHKDVWIRMGQYPAIAIGAVFGGDGAGTVIASGTPNDPLLNTHVFLTPSRGWEKDPQAPESRFGILGGGSFPPLGTFAEYIVVERDQVIQTPKHLDDVHVAAWPIGGVTAWRAVAVNAQVKEGQNILITGIGGGVALLAMQLCIAMGANVYVTSGSADKLSRAISLGAKGGANYKDKDWWAQIGMLLNTNKKGAMLDAIIDSAGGDIMGQAGKILKQGGRVVCYGMTANPKITLTMRQVLANQQLLGSTMGSHQDLKDATDFIAKHRIVPIVSHVLDGLESADEGFELLKRGDQFGKVVIKLRTGIEAKL